MSFTLPEEHQNEPILTGMNAEQYKATVTPGSMLVLAGAGSGKTRVLSSRVAWNIKNGVQPSEILAVTFTNKASREMKGRIKGMLGDDFQEQDLWVGTFHSICVNMLRQFGKKAGVDPNFHILDTSDQASLVKRIFKDQGITTDDLKVRGETLNSVVAKISKIKENGGLPANAQRGLVEDTYQAYVRACEKEGALDFADLMLKANQALSQNLGGIRDHFQNRFTRILVDEFQDTNPEQYKWLSLIKGPEAELFAVGDDDQSIYAFRGADPESMGKFLKGSASGNIIRLEQNYRSTGHILSAANNVIAVNQGRIGKTLRTNAGSGEKINVVSFDSDYTESDYIAASIKSLLDQGTSHQEIAVLYRSNFQSMGLERAMLKKAVPYVIHGGTRFFERMEVKDVVAYLRLAFKPEDNSAFYRVVNLPPRGLGAKATSPIYEIAKNLDISYMDVAMDEAHERGGKIQGFTDVVTELMTAINMMDLPDFIRYTLEMTGLADHHAKDDEGESRVKNMEQLVTLATRYINELPVKPETAHQAMGDFLATFTLEDISTQDSHNHQAAKKAVTLMTVHSSKGLEFEHVFISGVEEGLMPHANAVKEPGGEEEERRLMYVAITRAKKSLTIAHSEKRMQYGNNEDHDPSRFLADIPEFAATQSKQERPKFNNNKNYYNKPRF